MGLNKSNDSFDTLRDIQRDFANRLDNDIDRKLTKFQERLQKMEYFKIEAIQHFEQNLPL